MEKSATLSYPCVQNGKTNTHFATLTIVQYKVLHVLQQLRKLKILSLAAVLSVSQTLP